MAHILKDRILESSTTTGTVAMALAGAVVGFRRFSDVAAIGDTMPYFIEAIDTLGQPTGAYEYGIGTYSAANTLTRTTVEGSSNGGALVNFAAGSKNVGLSLNASGFARSTVGSIDVIKLPDGTMIQTGASVTSAAPGTGTAIAFATPFVAAPKVIGSNHTTSASGVTLFCGTETVNDFQCASSIASLAFNWMAVGRWK